VAVAVVEFLQMALDFLVALVVVAVIQMRLVVLETHPLLLRHKEIMVVVQIVMVQPIPMAVVVAAHLLWVQMQPHLPLALGEQEQHHQFLVLQ
jgi:hypothetical protein